MIHSIPRYHIQSVENTFFHELNQSFLLESIKDTVYHSIADKMSLVTGHKYTRKEHAKIYMNKIFIINV